MFQYNTHLNFPKTLEAGLSKLTKNEGKTAVRLSLRASNRVQRLYMKRLVRTLTSASRQSSGATYRAMDSKVSFPGKGKEFSGYALAGISRKYSEITKKTLGFGNPSKKTNIRTNTVTISSRKLGGRGKKSSVKKSYVRSWQRRSLRSYKDHYQNVKVPSPKSGIKTVKSRFQKNVPRNYWHLINDGFTHFSGTTFPGYQFTQKTQLATQKEAAEKFISMFSNQIGRMFG